MRIDHPAARLRIACWAARAQFFALGFVTGSWGVHIPTAKLHYGLDEARLSLVLLAVAGGAVLCLTQAGAVVSRLGARAVALGAGFAMCAALALVVTWESFAALIVLMLTFGAASALLDVAVNAEGTVLEAIGDKKVMSGFHAMFSVGGMAGAGAGALMIAALVPPARQLAAMGATIAALIALATVFMLPVHPKDPTRRSGYRLPRGALAIVGLLAAVGLLAEGAMYDWSVLYIKQETSAPAALAALGYVTFSAAMAAARFGGDWLRARISPPRLLAASGVLAAVAMTLVLIIREPLVALLGFALVGVGFANVVPILFMCATRVPGVTGATAIATVSSVGYLGFLAGPPLVGGIAQASSLTLALGVVVLGALLLVWGARRIPM